MSDDGNVKVKQIDGGFIAMMDFGGDLNVDGDKMADEIGRRLAMAGISDETRQKLEAAVADAVKRGPTGLREFALKQSIAGLRRGLQAIEDLPDSMLSVAKMTEGGSAIFNLGGVSASVECAVGLMKASLDTLTAMLERSLAQTQEQAEQPEANKEAQS